MKLQSNKKVPRCVKSSKTDTREIGCNKTNLLPVYSFLRQNVNSKKFEGENRMDREVSLLLNKMTIAYAGDHNENGEFITNMHTSQGIYQVDLEPKNLIDKVLKYYGSTYKGALASSKSILGTVDMAPICIGGPEGAILFSSMSPSLRECAYFLLHHVKSFHEINKKQTAVFLSNGQMMAVNVSKRSFGQRHYRALELKEKMSGRTLYHIPFDMGEYYQVVNEKENRTYRIKKKSD